MGPTGVKPAGENALCAREMAVTHSARPRVLERGERPAQWGGRAHCWEYGS